MVSHDLIKDTYELSHTRAVMGEMAVRLQSRWRQHSKKMFGMQIKVGCAERTALCWNAPTTGEVRCRIEILADRKKQSKQTSR